MSIFLKFRLFLKKSPTLYPLLKRSIGSGGTLTSKSTDLCIEGYPSSANSYTYHLFKCLMPELNLSHHAHSYANIKIALNNGIPSIVLIRHPLECISSRMVRFNDSLRASTLEYIDFYTNVDIDIESKNLILIDFNEIIYSTEECINKFSSFINLKLPNQLNFDQLNDCAKSRMEKAQLKNGKKMDNISLPSEQRSTLKRNIKNQLIALEEYKEAEQLYNRLSNRSILKK